MDELVTRIKEAIESITPEIAANVIENLLVKLESVISENAFRPLRSQITPRTLPAVRALRGNLRQFAMRFNWRISSAGVHTVELEERHFSPAVILPRHIAIRAGCGEDKTHRSMPPSALSTPPIPLW